MAVKIGFIGCGGIANQKHFPGMKQEQGVELVAFCDIVKERAEKGAKDFGTKDAKVYTDYKELLKDSSIDAVHVLTPNVSHCEITVAALEAGKHVLCEKPMAATTADAEKMVEARDKTGKMLTIGYQYRHSHENVIVKGIIDEGWLGEIYYTEAIYLRRRGVPTWGVFMDKAQQGGGPLIDIGTHALDLALYFTNYYDVDYVVGTSFEKLGRTLEGQAMQGQTGFRGGADTWDHKTYEVEDSAFGHIKMKNGSVINLKASWAINMINTGMSPTILAGTKGGVDTLDGVKLNHIVGGQQSVTTVGQKIPMFIPGFSGGPPQPSVEAQIWVKALKGEGKLAVTADHAFVITKILDSIY